MGFLLAVIHDVAVDPIDAIVHHMPDDFDPPPPAKVSSRCPCTWERAAADASQRFVAATEACLAGLSAANAQSRWREAVEAFQTRTRTMLDHPEYGRSDPACARCGGSGRYETAAHPHLESAGYCALPWTKVLRRACTTPRSWPIGWQLGVAFSQKLGVATFVPAPVQDEAIDPRQLGVAPHAPLAVALLLERGLIPDVAAIVDRSGAWHEREEIEIAEDLASWHARIQTLLRASPDANVSVLEAR